MSLKYEFIGWNSQGKHDKVWVTVKLGPNKYLAVYGRRGKKLRTKVYEKDWWDISKLISAKRKKGYVEFRENQLKTVYPEFEADLQTTSYWMMMTT